MSWGLASFALLALALGAGFAWYERSRPSSKVLAVVATLAALAALGRIAFAPLPNVKPTTDIVLIAGYTLGGAPGFAIGAVSTLASNFFFGQGPWTPWEMFAWGLVGIGGAALARISGRRLGRVPLALACALAGLAHGAIMDFSTWIQFTGQHTLGQYLVVSGQSLPFNVAHAVGNLLFALAFGPALVRALLRFRARFEVTWLAVAPTDAAADGAGAAPWLALVALVAVGAALGGSAVQTARAAFARPPAGVARAHAGSLAPEVGYLQRSQNRDGGFGCAYGQSSNQLCTAWAAIGLAAAHHNPRALRRNGRSPIDYIVTNLASLQGTGDVERTILALAAAHVSPRHARGHDLVAALLRRRGDGTFGDQVNLASFAVLALRAAGRSPHDREIRAAAGWITRQQNADGGFNFAARGAPSGVDDSAAALQALVAAGRRRGSRAVRRASHFLAAEQNADGGFPLVPGQGSNAQSTAWAIQGLVAAGRRPGHLRGRGGRTAAAYLRSLVGGDGSVRYSPTSAQTPVWVTAQALTGLAHRPLPIG